MNDYERPKSCKKAEPEWVKLRKKVKGKKRKKPVKLSRIKGAGMAEQAKRMKELLGL